MTGNVRSFRIVATVGVLVAALLSWCTGGSSSTPLADQSGGGRSAPAAHAAVAQAVTHTHFNATWQFTDSADPRRLVAIRDGTNHSISQDGKAPMAMRAKKDKSPDLRPDKLSGCDLCKRQLRPAQYVHRPDQRSQNSCLLAHFIPRNRGEWPPVGLCSRQL